ncbi:MAG: dihydrofolate reductase family protein [Chloroflexota bacterium]
MLTIPRAPTMERIESLFSRPPQSRARGVDLPPGLKSAYGGDLPIALRTDRPTLVTNFVSTLDGVISYNTSESDGGGEISGHSEPDRFVMGLLRALADVVLVGAGTVRAAPDGAWTPSSIHPASSAQYAALRRRLGLRPNPITAIVTASGAVDLRHPGLADPALEVVVVTTRAGEAVLRQHAVPRHIEIHSTGDRVQPRGLVQALALGGAELILCEGGPHLLGQLLEGRVVDEMFLTFAPQLAGRSSSTPRLNLVEGTAFTVAEAPWARLADLRRAGDYLFARYDLTEGKNR